MHDGDMTNQSTAGRISIVINFWKIIANSILCVCESGCVLVSVQATGAPVCIIVGHETWLLCGVVYIVALNDIEMMFVMLYQQ